MHLYAPCASLCRTWGILTTHGCPGEPLVARYPLRRALFQEGYSRDYGPNHSAEGPLVALK